MFLHSLSEFLNEHQPLAHVRRLWRPDIGSQIVFSGDEVRRIPHDGAGKRGEPHYHDTAYYPPVETVTAVGINGWNYIDQVSEHWTFDLDSIANHKAGLAAEQLAAIVEKIKLVPEAEVVRSKSGAGYHIRLFSENPPLARTHNEHQRNGQAALAWLAEQTGLDLAASVDCCGMIAWIYHRETGPNGFELVKAAERKLAELPPAPQPKPAAAPKVELSGRQSRLVEWLAKNGYCTIDAATNRVTTHTALLKRAQQTTTLRIRGPFETVATGREPDDHTCYLYPQTEDDGGGWRVFRYNGAKEHSSWEVKNGNVFTTFDRRKTKKEQVVNALVRLAADDDLFHGPDGRAYATLRYGGRIETWMILEETYRAVLRRRYFHSTGQIASEAEIKNAVAELSATARLERPESKVFVRVGEHQDAIYIDLCDAERRAVEITAAGWQVVNDPPVRFRRTAVNLPLPAPERGGSIDLLRPFCNVTDAQWPLLVGALLAAYRPIGPYPALILTGEPGAAKSTLSRIVQKLVDPNGGDVRAAPKNIEDLAVAAHNAWLVAYDNISDVSQSMSDALCRLSTGGGFGRRKLYADEAETVFHSQRPLILNSIRDCVSAPDLLDRAIALELERLSSYRDETTFWADFAKVQPLVFGALLNGISAALRDFDTVVLDDAPRLADFGRWVSAAEPAIGFPLGTILGAFRGNGESSAADTMDCELGRELLRLAAEKFTGEPSTLAKNLGWSVPKLSGELRMMGPSLRRAGIQLTRRKSNGKRIIELQMA